MVAKHTLHGLDSMESKVNRLSEIMKEAKTLAEELASHGIEVSVEVVK